MITCPKELPATVLPEGCYKQMFYNNNKVNYTKAPDIKATTYGGTSIQTLSDNAMFYAQSSNPNKLNYIRVYRTTWNTSYSSNWVQGVQTTAGSFYCPPQLTRTRGNSYIPTNWTVYSYDLTFHLQSGAWTDETSEDRQYTWRTDVSDVTTFLSNEVAAGTRFYSDAACTSELTQSYIESQLSELQNTTTWTIYVNGGTTPAGASTYTVTLADDATGYGSINESSITEVEDGATITIDGNTLTIGTTTVTATPTTANAQYTYTFTGWYNGEDQLTGSSNTVTADTTITAHFTRTTNTYTITWQNEDGTTLETDENVAYGTTPTYDGETPTKTAAGYTYTFSGWTPTITAVTGKTTYTAQFDAVAATTLDLYDDQDATYYNNIKALNGQTYDVTYHRSVAYTSDNGNARWYTLCLPFDVDQSQLDINGLTGKVYEYRYAEGSADENDHVTFHFRAVKSPNLMLAGQGYLVKATGNMGPDFTFENVTLDTDKDTETDVNDLKLNSANAYKESGDIAIVGVLRNGTLSAAGKQVMGLANNKIWYPHSSGNPMPAYRAYFYNPNAS
ncbi:MAG: hypothetical protein IJ838_00300, partial [Paludibacteraceae bacterium]|nr:hypothetical protein [Paludibacteraceae bacterium]